MPANGTIGSQSESEFRHLVVHQYAVRGAVPLRAVLFGRVRAIAEAGFHDANGLRTHRNALKFESPFAVGERPGFGVAFNLYQGAGQRFATDRVADNSVNPGAR